MSSTHLLLSFFLSLVLPSDLPPHILSPCVGDGSERVNVQRCARGWLLAGAPVPPRFTPRLNSYAATRPRVFGLTGGAGPQPHPWVAA
jgi:hypothetical protein